MVEITDFEIDDALARGAAARQQEPRATRARYDRRTGRVVVHLSNSCAFAFPPSLAQGLESASDEALAQVEVIGDGYGLRWECADVDLSVPGLLAGLFGTRSHMARLAGRRTSPAKANAARTNGAKGGRPRKQAAS